MVFRPTPLKNDGVSSSVGMMTFPKNMGKSFKIPWFQSPPTSNPFIDGISTYILGDTLWDDPSSIFVKVSQVTGGGDLGFFFLLRNPR